MRHVCYGLSVAAALVAGCSAIVDSELAKKADAGHDSGPSGPACTTTADCLELQDHIFDCSQVCVSRVCVRGMQTPDGTKCGGTADKICVAGSCVMRGCGDGYVERDMLTQEYCDDGNTNDTDACNNMCTASCVPPATPNCDDGNPCNGSETCNSMMGVCVVSSAPLSDGQACMTAMGLGSCMGQVCVVPPDAGVSDAGM